jgi:hypothetical protein
MAIKVGSIAPAIALIVVFGGSGGCQGRAELERYMAGIRPGMEGAEAFRRLQKIHFSPRYETEDRLVGQRTDGFGLLWDDWSVQVDLDEAHRVISSPKLQQTQSYP